MIIFNLIVFVNVKVFMFSYLFDPFMPFSLVLVIVLFMTEFRPDPARKLSANLYDIYHCCVYSEKLLTMDRGTVRNM